jgi:hypothetical protein
VITPSPKVSPSLKLAKLAELNTTPDLNDPTGTPVRNEAKEPSGTFVIVVFPEDAPSKNPAVLPLSVSACAAPAARASPMADPTINLNRFFIFSFGVYVALDTGHVGDRIS